MTSLGKQLRRKRTRAGLSGRMLAQLVGISPAYLCDIELDRRLPSLKVLNLICRTLAIDKIECTHGPCRRCGQAWPGHHGGRE